MSDITKFFNSTSKNWFCVKCNYVSGNSSNFKLHLTTKKHTKNTIEETSPTQITKTENGDYYCEKCEYHTADASNFKKHIGSTAHKNLIDAVNTNNVDLYDILCKKWESENREKLTFEHKIYSVSFTCPNAKTWIEIWIWIAQWAKKRGISWSQERKTATLDGNPLNISMPSLCLNICKAIIKILEDGDLAMSEKEAEENAIFIKKCRDIATKTVDNEEEWDLSSRPDRIRHHSAIGAIQSSLMEDFLFKRDNVPYFQKERNSFVEKKLREKIRSLERVVTLTDANRVFSLDKTDRSFILVLKNIGYEAMIDEWIRKCEVTFQSDPTFPGKDEAIDIVSIAQGAILEGPSPPEGVASELIYIGKMRLIKDALSACEKCPGKVVEECERIINAWRNYVYKIENWDAIHSNTHPFLLEL
jgi:hypothetical protein